ncbi:hypothetical protein B296_00058295 [Ensete ventricosum]|uniref:Uncharacterized protein n=1 Tax=Ensete ventricosum TaxID=4639 RepID=A0A426X0U4_ENSVE|nr:hypothetical protein B296_00058295 [Ensete ventricosum]
MAAATAATAAVVADGGSSCRWQGRRGKTRTARYIPVRQLTGTWTGRYRAVPLRSVVNGRFRPSMIDFRRLRSI